MDEQPTTDAVRRFLHDHIATVAQLEILLLLQTNPQQKWPPAKVAHELRADTAGTELQLKLLEQHTLIKRDDTGSYHYQPASPELHAAVVAVAQAYLVRRVAVIEMIYSKPPDNLRAFSDAFRLRKDDPGGSPR